MEDVQEDNKASLEYSKLKDVIRMIRMKYEESILVIPPQTDDNDTKQKVFDVFKDRWMKKSNKSKITTLTRCFLALQLTAKEGKAKNEMA